MEFNRIIQGDAKEVLKTLPGESVNCIMTSPPYWGLRDYGIEGQLGSEKTFQEYITKLCDIFDEGKRVLKADGTCWVNLGDTYNGSNGSHKNHHKNDKGFQGKYRRTAQPIRADIPTKSLCLIPQRFAIEMINRGWVLRNTIIWHKPNGMPASAKDRFTVDFEYLYYFTKSNKTLFWTNSKTGGCTRKQPAGIKGIEGKDWEWRRKGEDHKKELKKVSLWRGHDYWFEQQFESHTTKDDLDRRKNKYWSNDIADGGSGKQNKGRDRREFYGKHGRNKRTVWTIPTQPYPEAHFAVFPEGFIEIPIQAGCPKYVCKKCGLARMKLLEPTEGYKKYLGKGNLTEHHAGQETKTKFKVKTDAEYEFKGYTDCGCNEGSEGGIVLDPFMGAGTTAVVAKKQGKRYLGIELKEDYIKMANKRIDKTRRTPETLF